MFKRLKRVSKKFIGGKSRKKNIVYEKYPYKDPEKLSKKKAKKKYIEEVRKADNKLKDQLNCNHSYDDKSGHDICNICGAHLITDKTTLITSEALEGAIDIIYAFYANVNSRYKLSRRNRKRISKSFAMMERSKELCDKLTEMRNKYNTNEEC